MAKPPKWEYRIERCSVFESQHDEFSMEHLEAVLNAAGNVGWQFCWATRRNGGIWLLYKRQK